MKDKGEISAFKAWLIVVASLLDDFALLVVIFLALRFFHVPITWPIILAAVLVVAIFFIIMHKAVVPAIRRRRTTGSEGMIGQTGEVTQALKPRGVIKIKNEYWDAKSVDGSIDVNNEVEVVGINRLILDVKKKQ
jgi:membrane-bound serine protease (ClpP class)